MQGYWVSVPVVGYAEVYVDAESENDAVECAIAKVQELVKVDDHEDLAQWELTARREAVRGNVYYGQVSEAEVDIAL